MRQVSVYQKREKSEIVCVVNLPTFMLLTLNEKGVCSFVTPSVFTTLISMINFTFLLNYTFKP